MIVPTSAKVGIAEFLKPSLVFGLKRVFSFLSRSAQKLRQNKICRIALAAVGRNRGQRPTADYTERLVGTCLEARLWARPLVFSQVAPLSAWLAGSEVWQLDASCHHLHETFTAARRRGRRGHKGVFTRGVTYKLGDTDHTDGLIAAKCSLEGTENVKRVLKLLGLLIVAWCAMTFTHETGHVISGWLTGASLQSCELRPWHLPHSLFDPNPYPLITLWGGPVLGVFIPLIFALTIRSNWSWFVCHFCLVANGFYIAVAWVSGDPFLDTPQLLRHGASPSLILLYCVLTIGVGYAGFRKQCELILAPTLNREDANPDQ
jgi:hypothetical protein